MCDNCGVEKYSEVGEKKDGYFLSALHVNNSENIVAEVYACSVKCLPNAVLSALKRAVMTDEELKEAMHNLWVKGRE
jgi:hypothetical protein